MKSIENIENIENKIVILRLDLNVPLNKEFSRVPVTAWTVAISPPETTSTPQPLSSNSFTKALQINALAAYLKYVSSPKAFEK